MRYLASYGADAQHESVSFSLALLAATQRLKVIAASLARMCGGHWPGCTAATAQATTGNRLALNVVSGSSASSISGPILRDPRLRKLSFTGSTPVGKHLLKDAADHVLRTSMELGGNAPLIVFEDADVDAAVEGAFAAKMRNMGEACTAANRFLVHEDVAEEFTQKFVAKLEALKPLRGTDPESTLGPIVDELSLIHI